MCAMDEDSLQCAPSLLVLQSFCVSTEMGFVLQDPLAELPQYYRPWTSLASDLTRLIETHQLQDRVREMPLLSTQLLRGHREHRLAHLALGFITMGYVWQEGPDQPAKTLPQQLAVPYCSVSDSLGLPPILVYADVVLANWRLKDPEKPFEMGNLDTLFTFPGGETSKGFLLVSLLVEQAASLGMQGVAMAMNSMLNHDNDGVLKALEMVAESLLKMKESFELMHRHVEPGVYHGTLRHFFSGWRDNPSLPEGLRYEGVYPEPLQLSGGSAAQSSAIQCFDALLGIRQNDDSAADYLKRVREYMPQPHRKLIELVSAQLPLRSYVISTGDTLLAHAYDTCVLRLTELRSYHLNAVACFITVPRSQRACTNKGGGCPVFSDSGTGGTKAFHFLKSVRDSTRQVLIHPVQPMSRPAHCPSSTAHCPSRP